MQPFSPHYTEDAVRTIHFRKDNGTYGVSKWWLENDVMQYSPAFMGQWRNAYFLKIFDR